MLFLLSNNLFVIGLGRNYTIILRQTADTVKWSNGRVIAVKMTPTLAPDDRM